MYLNIINNIKYENKRNSKSSIDANIAEKQLEDKETKLINLNNDSYYHCIFYGDLTKNWIKLNQK